MQTKFRIYIQSNTDPDDADMAELGLNYTRIHAEGADGQYLGELSGWFPKAAAEELAAVIGGAK